MNPLRDFLVIGGGVMGLALARELRLRHPDQSVTVLEKESFCGFHASGRNSGVLHAGLYYPPDSLKARFTREGSRLMRQFCLEHRVPLNPCGKIVTAVSEDQLPALEELYRRGTANGATLQWLDDAQAKALEPRVRTLGRALFSPETAVVDPKALMIALAAEVQRLGGEIRLDTPYRGRTGDGVTAGAGERWRAGHVINAAGLHADRVARDFGFGLEFAILPFIGLYLMGDEPPGWLRTHLYPTPDLDFPFLGVHGTVTAEGRVKVGPTALPAFWREQYQGWSRFRWQEFLETLGLGASLLWRGEAGLAALAAREFPQRLRRVMLARAATLIEGIDPARWRRWGARGLRAQLVHRPTGRLVMDFYTEGDHHSLHLLNTVSPGLTGSLAFARHLLDDMAKRG
ncbi:MAG: L-2-hydroxyglutarate oxidase [Magnetococcales bacterium]|nr:L-2-hydroxyglutarate oxidase [Magnetococcales bacterium]